MQEQVLTDHRDTKVAQVLRNVTVQRLSIQSCMCCDVTDVFVCVLEILCCRTLPVLMLCHALLCCSFKHLVHQAVHQVIISLESTWTPGTELVPQ